MVDLRQLQADMRSFVTSGTWAQSLDDIICGDGFGALQRLSVHKNTYRESLVSVLEAIFPLVKAFVGDSFLRHALGQFVLACPPSEPMLFCYGGDFPGFLGKMDALGHLPYVADIATLEWMTHELMQVEESEETQIFGKYALNPNIRFVESSAPLFDLWRVAMEQEEAEKVNLDAPAQSMLVLLSEGEILYQPIPAGECSDFLRAAIAGAAPPLLSNEAEDELMERGVVLEVNVTKGGN